MEVKETRTFKTKWHEFKYGEWRNLRPSVYVTLDTEIPAMPEKVLEKPNEDAYQAKLKELEGKIKDIGKSLEEKKGNFDELLAAKSASQKGADGAPIHTKEIGAKLAKVKELQAKKRQIFDA